MQESMGGGGGIMGALGGGAKKKPPADKYPQNPDMHECIPWKKRSIQLKPT